jgi:hypothetical protein
MDVSQLFKKMNNWAGNWELLASRLTLPNTIRHCGALYELKAGRFLHSHIGLFTIVSLVSPFTDCV